MCTGLSVQDKALYPACCPSPSRLSLTGKTAAATTPAVHTDCPAMLACRTRAVHTACLMVAPFLQTAINDYCCFTQLAHAVKNTLISLASPG